MSTEQTGLASLYGFAAIPNENRKPFATCEPIKMDVVRCSKHELVLFDRRPYGEEALCAVSFECLPTVFTLVKEAFLKEVNHGCVDEFIGKSGERVALNITCNVLEDIDEERLGVSQPGLLSIKTCELPEVCLAMLGHMESIDMDQNDEIIGPFWERNYAITLPTSRKELADLYVKGESVGMGV